MYVSQVTDRALTKCFIGSMKIVCLSSIGRAIVEVKGRFYRKKG